VAGAIVAQVRHDATLPADRVALAAGPDPADLHPETRGPGAGALALAVVADDGTWRGTRVRVREA